MTKRVISLLLILVMLVGMLPVFAQAEEAETSVDSGELTVEGTNGFGTLLAEDIAQEQEAMEEEQQAGYTLTDLQITGNTATVTYDSLEEATLVVALYTEDGMQLLTSGKTTVSPEETTATVTIEGDMPQYFLASAYLLDSYDFSPLCPAYDTPMYTQEMQELLASTAEDYDADRVLQLEESPETNFAVYAETTKVIDLVEGYNTVTLADEETNTYIIENADESFTSLQAGDVFAYSYGENEILIAKVGTIAVTGTTVTILGEDLELQDAFSHVKIEGESGTEDVTVDDSTAYPGITYEGVVSEGRAARAVSGGDTVTASHKFSFSQKIEEETDRLSASVTASCSLKLQLSVGVNYYVSLSKCYVEFKVSPTIVAGLYAEGRIEGKLPLGTFGVSPCPGVFVGFEPHLVLTFTGKIDLSFTMSTTIGIRYDNKTGLQNISTAPKITPDLKVEATIFLGVDFEPKVTILGEKTCKLGLSATVGVELKAKATGTEYEIPTGKETQLHTCKECLALSLTFKASLSGNIKFLNCKWLEVNVNIGNWTQPLGNAYYSLDQDKFDFGACPNVAYRVTFYVKDAQKLPASDVLVSATPGGDLGTTNSNGVVETFLPASTYQFTAFVNGPDIKKTETISQACNVNMVGQETIDQTNSDNVLTEGGILDTVPEQSEVVDYGTLVASGTCGNNATWTLYSKGLLHIDGYGAMSSYPWSTYASQITKVVIGDEVTSIAGNAFYGYSNLSSVVIGNGVTTIGASAFNNCISLRSVEFGQGIRTIYADAFCFCNSLDRVSVPDIWTWCNITFSDREANPVVYAGKLYISDQLLTDLVIPQGITSINSDAFQDCDSLTSVSVSEGVVSINESAFSYCDNLRTLTISDTVTLIEEYAFYNCTNLSAVNYVGTETQWAAISIGSSNTALTNATINFSGAIEGTVTEELTASNAGSGVLNGSVGNEMADSNAVFGGEYGMETENGVTYKTAQFKDLIPGADYVMLALVSLEAEAPLSWENLLFIDQDVAAEDGTLSFRYLQREETALSYVVACGASNKNLTDAFITFPEMTADGETQVVDPTVVYEGVPLTEGKDYVITGEVDFIEAGEYTCYIRGIYNYTGLVPCTYTVAGTVEEEVTQPTLKLSFPTLTFEDMISMNVYFSATDIQDVVEMGMIAYSSQVVEYGIETAEKVITGYSWSDTYQMYVITTGAIAAKDMSDKIFFAAYAKLSDGTYAYSSLVSYSPTSYANTLLSSGDEVTKNLMVAMLNYGAEAQTFFGYRTDALMNASLTEEQKASIESYRADMMASVSAVDATKAANFTRTATGFTSRYPSISFEGAFQINYYCVPSAVPAGEITLYYWNQADFDASEVLTVDNATGTIPMTQGTDRYEAAVTGIAAKDLDKGIYVAFVYSDGSATYCSGILGYSIGAYCVANAATTDAISPFAQATAVYGYYAKQFFGA